MGLAASQGLQIPSDASDVLEPLTLLHNTRSAAQSPCGGPLSTWSAPLIVMPLGSFKQWIGPHNHWQYANNLGRVDPQLMHQELLSDCWENYGNFAFENLWSTRRNIMAPSIHSWSQCRTRPSLFVLQKSLPWIILVLHEIDSSIRTLSPHKRIFALGCGIPQLLMWISV